jgi:hypothetical protein
LLAISALTSLAALAGLGLVALAAANAPTLEISSPANGDLVEQDNFLASGFARGGDLSARLVTSQGDIEGVRQVPAKSYDWSFQFSTPLSLDEDVTIFVRCTGSNSFTERSRTFHWKSR